MADIAAGVPRLWGRSGIDITAAYPELAGLGRQVGDALLDGEVVVLTREGRPSFAALAERMHVREPARVARLAASLPVTYMIFDLLRLQGADLTAWSYARRRAVLEQLRLDGPAWTVPPFFSDGPATWQAAEEHGLEGVMAKRLDSAYRPGARSADWVKVKLEVTEDFVIGGWRPGARLIGGLLVGVPGRGGQLVYRGRVGGGISAATERELLAALEPLRIGRSPFAPGMPGADVRGVVWVEPRVVVEVRYAERTPDGRLRFPRLRRIRHDRTVADVDDAG